MRLHQPLSPRKGRLSGGRGMVVQHQGQHGEPSVCCQNVDNGCDNEGTIQWMLEHFAGCRFHMLTIWNPACHHVIPPRDVQPEGNHNFFDALMEVKEALRGV
ncbi:hypothetical protein MRX96_028218 [Rhipicephalus microplus]